MNAGTLAVLIFLACPASSSSRNVPIFTTRPVYVWPACLIACTSDSEFGLFAEASTWMPALTRASAVVGPIAATCKKEREA